MRSFLNSLFEVFETVLIAVVVVFLIRTFVAQPFIVYGMSMETTFKDGDYLLVDQFTYRLREPKRGEPVVLLYPKDPEQDTYYIKRIIGLPGEHVILYEGRVVVQSGSSSVVLDEPYVEYESSETESVDIQLKEDEFFVMGDNRRSSYDSRSWGPLPRSKLLGLVRLRLWPLSKVSLFEAPRYADALQTDINLQQQSSFR